METIANLIHWLVSTQRSCHGRNFSPSNIQFPSYIQSSKFARVSTGESMVYEVVRPVPSQFQLSLFSSFVIQCSRLVEAIMTTVSSMLFELGIIIIN